MSEIPQAPNGAAKPAERRVRHGLIEDWRDAVGILILLTAAAFFGALTTRFWPDEDTPKIATDITARLDAIEARQSPSELANLKDRAAKFDTRLAAAEAAIASGGAGSALGAPAALEAARKQIEDLGARLTALEAKLATTPDDIKATHAALTAQTANVTGLTTRLDTFAERLTKLESSDLIEMARRASLASAIANLMRAAQGSAPFKTELDVVAAMMPNEPRLKDLAPLAAKGLPTASTLMTSFGDLAIQALNAERAAAATDWMTHLWVNFISLIPSRAMGEVSDNTNEGRLARAGVRLNAGDFSAAMRELDAVKGPAREPLKAWLTNASARIKLEARLAELNTRAIEALSRPAGEVSETVPQRPAP